MLYILLFSVTVTQAAIIVRLCRDAHLNMWNHHGARLALILLSIPMRLVGSYTLVFADINRLKQLNSACGDHFITNRMLYNGLRVRRSEFAWRIWGDEFGFLIRGNGHAFAARVARQLAEQPLTDAQRRALADVEGCDPAAVKMSATFSIYANVKDVWGALGACSADVLARKAARDMAPCK
jgi:GGDEF domain-containing protein